MKKKNWLALLLVGAIAITSFQSCKKDETDTGAGPDTGPVEWVRSTVAPEDPREGAASFVINDQAYMVGGITALPRSTRQDDTWAFNGSQWEPKADFAGGARNSAVGFAIGNAGFVGTGYDGENALNDFYRFDASANTWTKIADFPGGARVEATAFALGGFGYVGLGRTAGGRIFSDMYRYNPQNDTWTLVPTQFGWARTGAFAFVIGNRAYIGGGSFNNQLPEDFFSFDGTTWTKLNDLNRSDDSFTYDVRRFNTSTFVIGGLGYVVSGRTGAGLVANVWKYNPANDSWTNEHQAIQGGGAREKAIGFALGNKGYISTGSNGTGVTNFFSETLVFTPVR